jgi:aerobic carbon-monoxide dehydrogenase medium subunit
LAEALPLVGHPQIRNRGTIGGSLAHADPASELPAVMALLDAELMARTSRGERTLRADEFFVSYFTTRLEPDELLTEVRLPAWPAGAGWAFLEVSRRHGDVAMVRVASLVRLTSDRTVGEARLAYTGVGATPVRARDAERELVGQPAAEDTYVAAAERAVQTLDPQADVHATAAYRRHVAGVLTRRALAKAVQRAQGGAA